MPPMFLVLKLATLLMPMSFHINIACFCDKSVAPEVSITKWFVGNELVTSNIVPLSLWFEYVPTNPSGTAAADVGMSSTALTGKASGENPISPPLVVASIAVIAS